MGGAGTAAGGLNQWGLKVRVRDVWMNALYLNNAEFPAEAAEPFVPSNQYHNMVL